MKKLLFALLAGWVSALVAINGGNAQNVVNPQILESQKNVAEIEKVITHVKDHIANLEGINPKALKDFTKTYINVTGASWEKIKDGFTTKFFLNGVKNIIYYNTKGEWTGSLKNYSENKCRLI